MKVQINKEKQWFDKWFANLTKLKIRKSSLESKRVDFTMINEGNISTHFKLYI